MQADSSKSALESFSLELIAALKECVPHNVSTSLKSHREKIWQKFHQKRTSQSYKRLWIDFVHNAISVVATPIFYQYVGNVVFQTILKSTFTSSRDKEVTVELLSYEEANALRYAAGYVCYKVQNKIKTSTHPLKDKLLFCLMELCDEDEDITITSDWVNAIDRGGGLFVSARTPLVSFRQWSS